MDSAAVLRYNVLMPLSPKTAGTDAKLMFTACAGAAFAWAAMSFVTPAMGGEEPSAWNARAIESRVYDLRAEQVVRSRREDILRAQLAALDAEEPTDELRATRDQLLELLLDRRRGEAEIAASYRELWDAQGYAEIASRKSASRGHERVTFDWPVEPELGISAHYDDPAYRARFGFAHKAIDIPVAQGSVVRSVADGVVEKVTDQGLGFNSIVVRHAGGYASMYGHVSAFLASEGDEVSMGDPIALSGGTPGTAGAGKMTTGAHLHLEFFKDGEHIDPLPLLPAR